MKNKIPTEILLAIYRALLGEIYPAIRAIVISYTEDRELTIRYYLERTPTDYDYDSLGVVMTEVLSDLRPSVINKVKEECVHALSPFKDLDILDAMIYARRERGD